MKANRRLKMAGVVGKRWWIDREWGGREWGESEGERVKRHL